MFRFIKKIYTKEEMRHWILIIRTAIYRTFILSFKHFPIYKKKAILKEY